MYSLLSRVFFCILGAGLVVEGALPKGWKACKRTSSDYSDCMVKQINIAIQSLKGGSKQLAVNPLDPLKILALRIDQGSGPISIKLDFKDNNLSGLTSCVVKTHKNNDWKELSGRVDCKSLKLAGDYKIDGRVLALPIKGQGKSEINLHDVTVNILIKLKQVEKGGKKYFQVTTFDCDINPAKTTYSFGNLFNGNKALGDSMNTFLNENGDQIFKELKPAISKALNQAFAQVSNQVFSKIPSEEINVK